MIKTLRSFGYIKTMMGLFALLTVPVLFCVYGTGFRWAFPLVVAYFLLAVILLISVPVVTLMNARHFTKAEMKAMGMRFFKVLAVFILFNGVMHILHLRDYGVLKFFTGAVPCAAVIAFFEVIFYKGQIKE